MPEYVIRLQLCDEEVVVEVFRDGKLVESKEFERYEGYLHPEYEVLAYVTLLTAEALGVGRRVIR